MSIYQHKEIDSKVMFKAWEAYLYSPSPRMNVNTSANKGMDIIALCLEMPWHAVAPPAANPSTASSTGYHRITDLHGIPWNLTLTPTLNLGAKP